ncbi:uncharacterized protein LOC105197954 isoform X1 [Solenopsis invicta]|uniref:uncharacterized protein LOC105197954 isoform X1 n=1 Tax=Solenopsis invicta TaxID=13686 RepID=UPI00193E3142|nr:uncharacterized protein LOC105197954 isoform X1 [Solenopsis invicta]
MLAISNPRREHLLHQRVVHAVIIHQRAIEYHKFIMSVYLVPSGILFVIMIIGLIVALFRVSDIFSILFNLILNCFLSNNLLQCSLQFSTSNDKSMILINVGLISVYLIYLFTLNYCGQILIDNGLNFFEATYNGLWYAAPLSIQKLLLFVMQRGRIPLTLTYYDLITSSIDGFATVLKAVVSYFMVLNSTQK